LQLGAAHTLFMQVRQHLSPLGIGSVAMNFAEFTFAQAFDLAQLNAPKLAGKLG
jgi:hypothetical protein